MGILGSDEKQKWLLAFGISFSDEYNHSETKHAARLLRHGLSSNIRTNIDSLTWFS
jgi:hypothetical protein